MLSWHKARRSAPPAGELTFTSLLEERTAAIFVGEPPGGAPSHYGDATSFTLPHSKLAFNVSTLHWDLGVAPTDVREVHEPGLPAPPTIEGLRSGPDPAIAAIRAWKPGGLLRDWLLERYRSGASPARWRLPGPKRLPQVSGHHRWRR